MNGKRLLLSGGLAMLLAAWGLEAQRTAKLRTERASLQMQLTDAERQRAERMAVEAEKSAAELAAVQAERDAVSRLRDEIQQMQRRVEERVRSATKAAAMSPAEREEPSISEEFAPPSAWKNIGRESPDSAMQTALAAAASGDLKALSATLLLEPVAREKAQRLLDRLPEEVSRQFATAEDFVALLSTPDVPLSEARLFDPKATMPEGMAMRIAEFRSEGDHHRSVPLVLRRAAGGDWRLVVPASAIEKYDAMLRGVERTK